MNTKQKLGLKGTFAICPRGHVVLLVSAAVIALYNLLRGNRALMNFLTDNLVHPYHRLMARITSAVPFSVAEMLYALVIIAVIAYIVRVVYLVIKRREGRLRRVYGGVVTLLATALALYAGVCLFWGAFYYSDGFSEKSGIEAVTPSASELYAVTAYFADMANEYSGEVGRDGDGLFAEDEKELFDRSRTIYTEVQAVVPCLEGPELRAKPMVFSKIMSYIGFTGFFFPFTGEANLNTDSPQCFLPATIAHELAHQRGVAKEEEANFVAVLACVESGDPVWSYSAALLAYTYLGNALRDADYELWESVYYSLNEDVRADLRSNNVYWERYETPVAEATEAMYSEYLTGQGQEKGIASYGACVDLLVAYYVGKV